VAAVDNRVRTVEQEISVCSDKVDKVADDVDKRVTDIDSRVGKMMKNLYALETDVGLNRVKAEVDKQLTVNNKDITDMSAKITELVGGDDWSQVVKTEVDKSLKLVSSNIQDVQKTLSETRAQAAEQRDKESRRNNVFIYKVPESKEARADDRNKEDINNVFIYKVPESKEARADDRNKEDINNVFIYKVPQSKEARADDRNKEDINNVFIYKVPESKEARADDRNKEDISFCLQLFNNVLQAGVAEEDFVHVFRLGRRGEDGEARPLMVQLASYTYKNLIMESLYKLRHAQHKFKGVTVSHDMTKSEREECKRLVKDAKAMSEQDSLGEFLYRVRQHEANVDCKNKSKKLSSDKQELCTGTSKILEKKVYGLFNKIQGVNRKGTDFSILYTNADTLTNKLNELKLLIRSLEHKPAVIAITEVKPKRKWHSNINELQIECIFSNDLYCVESREVLIYVDKCLDSSELSIGTKFKENIFIRINSDLVIGNIYRSPSSCQENDSELRDLIHLISNRFSKFILVGDFNFNDID